MSGNVIEPAALADIELATNPEPRCPCGLLLDRSGSMEGAPIAEVNRGLAELKSQLIQDALASRRVELSLISFDGNVTIDVDFTSPQQFSPSPLMAGGGTSR